MRSPTQYQKSAPARPRKPVLIHGHVPRRVRVIRTAIRLHRFVELSGAIFLRAVEHHVLEKMRQPRRPRPLVGANLPYKTCKAPRSGCCGLSAPESSSRSSASSSPRDIPARSSGKRTPSPPENTSSGIRRFLLLSLVFSLNATQVIGRTASQIGLCRGRLQACPDEGRVASLARVQNLFRGSGTPGVATMPAMRSSSRYSASLIGRNQQPHILQQFSLFSALDSRASPPASPAAAVFQTPAGPQPGFSPCNRVGSG